LIGTKVAGVIAALGTAIFYHRRSMRRERSRLTATNIKAGVVRDPDGTEHAYLQADELTTDQTIEEVIAQVGLKVEASEQVTEEAIELQRRHALPQPPHEQLPPDLPDQEHGDTDYY
jgi:hypothetical protein